MLLTDISPFAVLKFFETIKSLIADLAPEDSSLQPPFPALLRSNEPPSDEEAQVVTAFVATLDGRWATVAPHQETLTYMSPSREEERIQSLISSHKSIISACRRIPNEIWHDIFVLAAEPTVFYAEQNIKLKRRKTPWRISGVCRRWRAVAISTPRLWTHIFLESSDRNVDITGPPGYLSKLLERSKTFPLSVSIVHSTSLHTEQKGLVKLFQHCERWKHLHLTAPVGWAKLFQDNVKGKLYSLESLDIQFNSLAGSIVDFDAFEDAPKLYEVRINDERAIRIHLPWSQLARLQLPGRQSYSLDKITHASGYLSSFSLRFVEQLPVKPLPRVVDFSMTGPGPDVDNWNITQVFPSLRTLSIVRPYGTELLNQIISQLQFVSLQCLTLKDIIMDSQDNRLQLPNLKTLKVLRIDLLGKEELVKLAVEEHSGALRILPSLEDLHFFIPWPMESKLTELHYTDQSDLYSVLNAVGRTRCERLLQSDVGPTTDNMTPLSAPFCIPTTSNRLTGPTLKSLRLQFAARYLKPITWPNDCNLQEQVESGWREKDFRTIPAWKEETPALALWARFVAELCWELDRPWSDSFFWVEQDRNFAQLEKLEVVHLQSLYRSGLHHRLQELLHHRQFHSRATEERFEQFRFRERICAILDKWAPRFQEDLPNRHWRWCHKHVLAYVAEDDPIRKGPNALKLIYGRYDSELNSESRELEDLSEPQLSYCRPLITNAWASDF